MANIDAQLNTIKKAENGESVRDAIVNAIEAVNRDGAVTLSKLSATHNGRWKAGTGTAYNEVVVNVEGGGSSNYSMESFKVDVDTERKTYDAEEVLGKGKAWDKIIVDLDTNLEDSLGEYSESEPGTYDAEDYGFSGFKRFTIIAGGSTGEGPFTVKFYSDKAKTNLVQTEIVPKGGSATYKGTAIPPTVDGSFIGWTPNPDYVTRDMECIPIYGSTTYQPGEITDSWAVILANRGRPYPIGSYKSIGPLDYKWPLQTTFVKVAEGEQGTVSTWLGRAVGMPSYANWPYKLHMNGKFWDHCGLRTFLNGDFFNEALSPEFKMAIKQVNKLSVAVDNNGNISPIVTQDYFWAPNLKEMMVTQKVPGYIKNLDPNNNWYFHQGIKYYYTRTGGNVFTDDHTADTWSEIVESTMYQRYINNDNLSLCYMRDFLGNSAVNTSFFVPTYVGEGIYLRDGYRWTNDEFGPGLLPKTLTICTTDYKYTIVESPAGHNPKSEGWYEKVQDMPGVYKYILSADTIYNPNKVYAIRSDSQVPIETPTTFLSVMDTGKESNESNVCIGFCLGY